jgi:hypothetical protein
VDTRLVEVVNSLGTLLSRERLSTDMQHRLVAARSLRIASRGRGRRTTRLNEVMLRIEVVGVDP